MNEKIEYRINDHNTLTLLLMQVNRFLYAGVRQRCFFVDSSVTPVRNKGEFQSQTHYDCLLDLFPLSVES